MCLGTRGEFIKKEEWLNLREESSGSSLDSKRSPGTRMAGCPYALPPSAEFILQENKASRGDNLVQGDKIKDVHIDLPDIPLFSVYAHVSPSKIATTFSH